MNEIRSFNPARTLVTNFASSRTSSVEERYDEGVWVLDVCSSRNKAWLACALSNGNVQVYDYDRFQPIHAYKEDNNTKPIQITDFSSDFENILISSTSKGLISIFDIRQPIPALCIQIAPQKNEEALSVDLGFGGALVAVGSSKAKVHFFELRGGKLLGSYHDAHTEEVTRVRFQPESSWLVSGSEDGLACVFDTSQPSEETALQGILNVQSPLRKIGFFGPSFEGVYCLTGSETFSVWHHDTAQRICDFGPTLRKDLTELMSASSQVDYLVDCHWDQTNQSLSLLTGDHGGNGNLFRVEAGRITPLVSLKNGHKGDIRAWSHFCEGSFATVGEDARLCEWNETEEVHVNMLKNNRSGPPARRTKDKKATTTSPY